MFEQLRRSLNELLERATKPEDRRVIVVRMKSTLVQAKLGLDDLRDALAKTERKLEAERRELLTVRRRKDMALAIKDTETVSLAERFEKQHEQLVAVLEEKIAVQSREVAIGEREVEEMKAEIRKAQAGGPASASAPLDDPLDDLTETKAREELDGMARQQERTERDADADRRLEELKRRMGK